VGNLVTKGAEFARPLSALNDAELDAALQRTENALKQPGVLLEGVLSKIAIVELT
jgi:hypothetical protein